MPATETCLQQRGDAVTGHSMPRQLAKLTPKFRVCRMGHHQHTQKQTQYQVVEVGHVVRETFSVSASARLVLAVCDLFFDTIGRTTTAP